MGRTRHRWPHRYRSRYRPCRCGWDTGSVDAVTIRSAEPADVPVLVRLIRYGALAGTSEETSDPQPYRLALAEIHKSADGDVLVAELDGEVVGLCQLVMFRHLQHHGGRCAEVESLHVHPDHRRRGIGGQLLAAAVEAAGSAGCYRVQLTSNVARTDGASLLRPTRIRGDPRRLQAAALLTGERTSGPRRRCRRDGSR